MGLSSLKTEKREKLALGERKWVWLCGVSF